jgi:hypothetical protein
LPSEPEEKVRRPEPALSGPSLFPTVEPEPELVPVAEPEPEPEVAPAPVAEEEPAWKQFIDERERAIQDRDRESAAGERFTPSEPSEPAPWLASEPAPTFIHEPEEQEPEPEPAEVSSFWPGEQEPLSQLAPEPAANFDDAWALPDEEGAPVSAEAPESAAFPHPPPIPVPEPEPEIAVPPLREHTDWSEDDELFRAPPEPQSDDALQHEPEAPAPPEVDAEELEARRRQQEEAARAYEQARDRES